MLRRGRSRSKVEPFSFYGNNYYIWAQQMEIFLELLNVAYVLYEPCPSIFLGPEATPEEIDQSKAAVKKWKMDDMVCRTAILNRLSFIISYNYSRKKNATTAKELWDDLKLAYETNLPKRFMVRKYIEFRMLEKKSVVEQVQELDRIFRSINVASPKAADEKFHVQVIISKLPKSWKDVRIKLKRENYQSFEMLMDSLMVEEESRIDASHIRRKDY